MFSQETVTGENPNSWPQANQKRLPPIKADELKVKKYLSWNTSDYKFHNGRIPSKYTDGMKNELAKISIDEIDIKYGRRFKEKIDNLFKLMNYMQETIHPKTPIWDKMFSKIDDILRENNIASLKTKLLDIVETLKNDFEDPSKIDKYNKLKTCIELVKNVYDNGFTFDEFETMLKINEENNDWLTRGRRIADRILEQMPYAFGLQETGSSLHLPISEEHTFVSYMILNGYSCYQGIEPLRPHETVFRYNTDGEKEFLGQDGSPVFIKSDYPKFYYRKIASDTDEVFNIDYLGDKKEEVSDERLQTLFIDETISSLAKIYTKKRCATVVKGDDGTYYINAHFQADTNEIVKLTDDSYETLSKAKKDILEYHIVKKHELQCIIDKCKSILLHDTNAKIILFTDLNFDGDELTFNDKVLLRKEDGYIKIFISDDESQFLKSKVIDATSSEDLKDKAKKLKKFDYLFSMGYEATNESLTFLGDTVSDHPIRSEVLSSFQTGGNRQRKHKNRITRKRYKITKRRIRRNKRKLSKNKVSKHSHTFRHR